MADKVTRRSLLVAAGAAGAGVALAAAIGSIDKRPEARLSSAIKAARVGGDIPATDPASTKWYQADPILVPLAPQQVVTPYLDQPGVSELTVEAIHNGEQLAFRLGWSDASVDDIDAINQFRDAVAVMLPAKQGEAPPPIMMGSLGVPVHILQWRATWQRDLVERVDTETIYPHVVRDEPPEKVLPPGVAKDFYVGTVVGNPLSTLVRRTSVEEIVAEGFGSATSLREQRAAGGAAHENGGWSVTIGLPMNRAPAGAALEPGSTWPVAFAVWLGNRGNRGSRKQYANWISLELAA